MKKITFLCEGLEVAAGMAHRRSGRGYNGTGERQTDCQRRQISSTT
jgi:hypothetical protein